MTTSLRKTILAVDDTPAILKIIQGALHDEFFVYLATSAGVAVSTLGKTKVDLILLDIEMPETSGFDFMDILKKDHALKAIPVIFVTSHATEDFVIKAAMMGAKDYVVKPFDMEVLRNKVYSALKLVRI
jgi:putative two-component system response regulator